MGLKQIGGEIRAQPLNENFQYLDGKLLFGPESNRPNPGVSGRLYVTTDKRIIYEDTGTAWQKVGVVNWNDIDGKPTSFAPSAHAAAHAAGGSDPITPAAIGAAPAVHASQHRSGGSDPITPADIGAVAKSGDTMTGTLRVTNSGNGRQISAYDWLDMSSGSVGRAVVAQNAYIGQGDNKFKYRATHSNMGARGIVFDWGANAGLYYFDQGSVSTTADAEFTPTLQKIWHAGISGPFFRGAGSPEGVVTAPVGAIYQRIDGGAGTTFYVKESGTGNTGWVAK